MAGMMMGGADPNAPQGTSPTAMPGGSGAVPMGGGQGQLDTAATANKPQAGDPDSVTYATMVAGLREHVFGKGEQGIMSALQGVDPKDIGRVLGEVVFALVQEAAKQAQQAGRELDMDILLGVATELIDDITELLDAHGIKLSQQDREYALLYAQQLYVQSYNPTDDDRNAARQQLAQYKQDGSVDTAVKYVQQRGMENGTDPFGVQQMQPGLMSKGS